MAHSPPRLLPKGTQRVLIVDPFQPTREARSKVLRGRGIEVAIAEDLAEARVLFMPRQHDLVLLDARRYSPAESSCSAELSKIWTRTSESPCCSVLRTTSRSIGKKNLPP